jgi:hypothetical protein
MKTVTRTFHPLPFEHLEPKRFEDLVRQLTYDFRPWRQLEPTGRAGSDDGFDARGFEIVDFAVHSDEGDDRDEVDPNSAQETGYGSSNVNARKTLVLQDWLTTSTRFRRALFQTYTV